MSGKYTWDKEGFFPSSNSINQTAYYIWQPADTENARGVVQIIHGMCEHSGRYDNFARYLTQNGYIVCQNENLGHGKTGKDTLGFMSDTDGDVHLVDDAYKLSEIIRNEYANKPFYIIGHSMGSFIARQYCVKYGNCVDGAVFSGTSGGGVLFHIMLAFIKFLIMIKGAKASGAVVNKFNSKIYNKKFKPAKTGNEWLSRDEKVWAAFANDELCRFNFTLGGYKDLLTLICKISSKKWAGSVNSDLPVFLLSGLDDPVGDYGRGVLKVYKSLVDTGNKDVYIKLYEDGRHEMLNEINKEEVYGDILYFLDNGGRFK